MLKEFDVVVIGGGPGGYVASIRASQLGNRVACIDERKNLSGIHKLGGTCLNVGCIPSKALLSSSEEFENSKNNIFDHGIKISDISIDISKMMIRKEKIVAKITNGIEYLFSKNKIKWFKGHAKFVSKINSNIQIEIINEIANEIINAKNVIIATGSNARHLDNISVDNVLINDNCGALSFNSIPKNLVIIGAGAIGLELGSVWRRLGSNVILLEEFSNLLNIADKSIAIEATKQLKTQGLKIYYGVKILQIDKLNNCVNIFYLDNLNKKNKIQADRLIISIGRTPNINNLGLENIGIKVNRNGFIDVNEFCETNIRNIYAIGDVVRGPMLAHKAEEEGLLVAEIIDGQKPSINYNCIPFVIYTNPEIAWVGKTEQKLIEEGIEIKIGQFPFSANGRAISINKDYGFVKMIADKKTDEILGVHIISANASDLISEATVAMEFKASSEDISRICHAHPTLSESIREAALSIDKRAINIFNQ